MSAVIPLYVKTAYHEEPSFANTKVVTSLFQNQLKNDLGENFKRCVEFREARAALLSKYNEKFDFMELGKLAIDYSDGIVEAGKDVNADLLKYAKDSGRPVLDYPGEDFADAYKSFYGQICPDTGK
jgi:starch synthase